MKGTDFLKFLVKNNYISEVTAKEYEYVDLNDVVNNMYRTSLMSEEYLVSYLNLWKQYPIDIEQFEIVGLNIQTNIVERGTDFEKYLITPYSVQPVKTRNRSFVSCIKRHF